MSYLLRTRPVILFQLHPPAGVVLDLLDRLSALADGHVERMPSHWHINAPPIQDPVILVPKAALVMLPEVVHHYLTGLLTFVKIRMIRRGLSTFVCWEPS